MGDGDQSEASAGLVEVAAQYDQLAEAGRIAEGEPTQIQYQVAVGPVGKFQTLFADSRGAVVVEVAGDGRHVHPSATVFHGELCCHSPFRSPGQRRRLSGPLCCAGTTGRSVQTDTARRRSHGEGDGR